MPGTTSTTYSAPASRFALGPGYEATKLASARHPLDAGLQERLPMAFRPTRMSEYLARRFEQECLVIGIVHEPAQLAGEALDGDEVLLHSADERSRRHAGVARKRSVGDE